MRLDSSSMSSVVNSFDKPLESPVFGDGSWDLKISITDVNTERTLRVKGDTHIGGVMYKLTEELNMPHNWSDHALWWPKKNKWLTRTRSTLDQYGVQADTELEFTPMHKYLRIQLPDLRFLDTKVDFSIKVFNTVIKICKELGIRYPEELSLKKPLDHDDLRHNYQASKHKKNSTNTPARPKDTNTYIMETTMTGNNNHTPKKNSNVSSPMNLSNNTMVYKSPSPYNTLMNGTHNSPDTSFELMGPEMSLAMSPLRPSPESEASLLRPKTLQEKARMNVSWLDSSLSIMEQGVQEYDTLQLRFKFYAYYDLNKKYDAVRINQLYEQAKWEILNENVDCTEEEMLLFAAYQLQANLQANEPQPEFSDTMDEKDLAADLGDLEKVLTGVKVPLIGGDIMQIPELSAYLKFHQTKKWTLKTYKSYYFVFKDLTLCAYKSHTDLQSEPVLRIPLKGCEVTQMVNMSQNKFCIKLEVPSAEGMQEMFLKCEGEDSYAKWMAGCQLASEGKTMADSSYSSRKETLETSLAMMRPAQSPPIPQPESINPEDYVSARCIKKMKGKGVNRILEMHARMKEMSLLDSKLHYIEAWQALPDHGTSYFIVRFMGDKKDLLLGVNKNRLMKMDLNGDHIKTWRYSTMKAWNVNWEVKHMMLQFEEENVVFSCLSADCKVTHEFIGGYTYLSMRSKDQNQTLNEELFHKLTGGWV